MFEGSLDKVMGDLIGGVSIYSATLFLKVIVSNMKKPKTVNPLCFNDQTNQQVIDNLNIDYPISLKYNQDLVERIAIKYPLLNKSEVATIVKAVFSSFRDLLILGKVLNFNNLFFDTKLLAFSYHKGDAIFPAIKVQIATPPPLRKYGK